MGKRLEDDDGRASEALGFCVAKTTDRPSKPKKQNPLDLVKLMRGVPACALWAG